MKIAAFTNSSDGSGARRAFFEFVKNLSASHQVDLYRFSGSDSRFFPFEKFIQKEYLTTLENFDSLKVRPYLLSMGINLIRKIVYIFRLRHQTRKMCRDIGTRDYDFVFLDVCTVLRAPFHPKFLKIPSLLYLHHPNRKAYESPRFLESDLFQKETSVFKSFYKKISLLLYLTEHRIVGRIGKSNGRAATCVLTNSYYTREYIYRVYGLLADVVYPSVHTEQFRPLGLKTKNYILSVGGLEETKRFSDIIRAVALLPPENRPPVYIVSSRIVTKIRNRLESLARQKDVRITFFHKISEEELVTLYNEAMMTVFVPLMEPLGLVPLESMACGTPVIGIREGGVRETVIHEKNGLLVDRNIEELAGAIRRLMDDRELRNQLCRNAADFVRNTFSWDQANVKMESIIQKLIASDSHPENGKYALEP